MDRRETGMTGGGGTLGDKIDDLDTNPVKSPSKGPVIAKKFIPSQNSRSEPEDFAPAMHQLEDRFFVERIPNAIEPQMSEIFRRTFSHNSLAG